MLPEIMGVAFGTGKPVAENMFTGESGAALVKYEKNQGYTCYLARIRNQVYSHQ